MPRKQRRTALGATQVRFAQTPKGHVTKLQEWVLDYYQRGDAWSYRAHREIFDSFTGPKMEHREAAAYAA
jgi:hypothetical protein